MPVTVHASAIVDEGAQIGEGSCTSGNFTRHFDDDERRDLDFDDLLDAAPMDGAFDRELVRANSAA